MASTSRTGFATASTMNTIYSLRFTGQVIRWNQHKEVRSKHMRHARDDLENYHDWYEWLSSTMRDAVMIEVEKTTGKSISFTSDPPVADIVVMMDPRVKRNSLSPQAHTFITGVVQWRSIATNSEAMTAAVAWRLGDRMSQYGLKDEDEGWQFLFTPGDMSTAMCLEM